MDHPRLVQKSLGIPMVQITKDMFDVMDKRGTIKRELIALYTAIKFFYKVRVAIILFHLIR